MVQQIPDERSLPGFLAPSLLAPGVARYSLAGIFHGGLRRQPQKHHLGGLRIAWVSRESRTRATQCVRRTTELQAERIQEVGALVRNATDCVCGLDIRRRARYALRIEIPVPAIPRVVQSADLAQIAVRIVAKEAVVAHKVVMYLVAEVVEVARAT